MRKNISKYRKFKEISDATSKRFGPHAKVKDLGFKFDLIWDGSLDCKSILFDKLCTQCQHARRSSNRVWPQFYIWLVLHSEFQLFWIVILILMQKFIYKQKNFCSKMWHIDQLLEKLGVWHTSSFVNTFTIAQWG